MSVYTMLLLFIGVTYGALTILGGTVQLKQKKINSWASISMIIGGLLTLVSVIFSFTLKNYAVYILIIGLVLIHASAINNGYKMYGKINPKHHMIRLYISIVLIILNQINM